MTQLRSHAPLTETMLTETVLTWGMRGLNQGQEFSVVRPWLPKRQAGSALGTRQVDAFKLVRACLIRDSNSKPFHLKRSSNNHRNPKPQRGTKNHRMTLPR